MHSEYNFEYLTELFSDKLTSQQSDPFEGDVVICQSKTMEQYLNKTIADKKVIAANIEYQFMRNAINDVLSQCPESKFVPWLDPASMVWEIYALLPELEKNTLYPALNDYIHADNASPDFRRYQLALQITSVFDNYIGYRGDWLELWQESEKATSRDNSAPPLELGEHEVWQADLWRKLTVEKSEKVKFRRSQWLLKDNINAINPKKRSIFGISNLPPDYIEFFAVLKNKINLDFYYLMPCVEYWGDITRPKSILEGEGNRLLASWGMVGRDFFELLLHNEFNISQPKNELQVPPAETTTLLTALQYDIMSNSALDASVIKKIPAENIENDTSITINNSYSRMREVEILHDYILDLLNNKTCELSDIVVMAPNIEDYAPYVQAVFQHGESAADADVDATSFIAYNLADCSTLFTSTEAETFMRLLQLTDGKMISEELFEIISSESITRKFKFSKDDVETMRGLIADANIAWGKNREHREEILQEEYPDNNTWEFGFKRILAGYAFDCEDTVENGTLPLSLDNSSAIVAGKLIGICEKLFALADKMRENRNPRSWYKDIFSEIISDFFEVYGKKNEEILPLRQAIKSFEGNCAKANFEEELPLEVVRAAIEREFMDQGTGKSSFFRGGVTFCQLLPMRNIPFKSICVIGMNDGEFPRIDTKNGFNLALKEFRRGDRSLRNEDRYIFLETLLACKENFYVSYIGQSQADNEELAPSVIVDELLDYLELTTELCKETFVTNHPLHGFDARYFTQNASNDENQLFSYSKVYLRAAESVANSAKKPLDDLFCASPLPLPEKIPNPFPFEAFVSFFRSPSKFFLKYILNINLYDETTEPLQTSEPFETGTLGGYGIINDALDHKLKKKDFDIKESLKASGLIPSGVWGDDILNESGEISDKLYKEVSKLGEKQTKTKLVELNFDVAGFVFTLKGTFDNLYENGQAFFRPGEIKDKDKLRAWIWHQLAIKAGIDIPETIIIGLKKDKDKDETNVKVVRIITIRDSEESENCENEPVSPADHMAMLSEIFVRGLQKPLPLFTHSSPAFTTALIKKSTEDALKIASGKWDDPYAEYNSDLSENANYICFGENPPPLNDKLKEEFAELAEAIYSPIKSEVR